MNEQTPKTNDQVEAIWDRWVQESIAALPAGAQRRLERADVVALMRRAVEEDRKARPMIATGTSVLLATPPEVKAELADLRAKFEEICERGRVAEEVADAALAYDLAEPGSPEEAEAGRKLKAALEARQVWLRAYKERLRARDAGAQKKREQAKDDQVDACRTRLAGVVRIEAASPEQLAEALRGMPSVQETISADLEEQLRLMQLKSDASVVSGGGAMSVEAAAELLQAYGEEAVPVIPSNLLPAARMLVKLRQEQAAWVKAQMQAARDRKPPRTERDKASAPPRPTRVKLGRFEVVKHVPNDARRYTECVLVGTIKLHSPAWPREIPAPIAPVEVHLLVTNETLHANPETQAGLKVGAFIDLEVEGEWVVIGEASR